MLDEVALTPDIFDGALYSSQDACDIHLRYVREPLLHEVLVRDLRNGDWSAYVGAAMGRWHPKGKELFRKLAGQSRLRAFRPVGAIAPGDDDTWCDEAIAASGVEPVAVILSTNDVARRHAASPLVQSIETATNTAWWRGRSPSKRVSRNTAAYVQALRLVLANSNSLMFIDPHVDPTRHHYRNFIQLLLAARRAPATRLEIHRCCYDHRETEPFSPAQIKRSWNRDFETRGVQPSKLLESQLLYTFGQTSTTDT